MFKFILAVFFGVMLVLCLWCLFILPFMSWDLLHWDYYAAVRSGRGRDFIFTFVHGVLLTMYFIGFVAAIPMLAAVSCSVIGWDKLAAKFWGVYAYLHALVNKKREEA